VAVVGIVTGHLGVELHRVDGDEPPVDGRPNAAHAAICDRLQARLQAVRRRATIEQVVADELAEFASARVTTFVPILVERRALERLRHSATADGAA
jgi:hypothetical protein